MGLDYRNTIQYDYKKEANKTEEGENSEEDE
jgi:hypothetical protein